MLPQCTIGMLIHACQLSYRMAHNGQIDPNIEENPKIKLKSSKMIESLGYKQIAGIKPKTEGGQGETGLAAIALKPSDPLEPIVISFRGTKTWSDVQSDISIMQTGLAAQHQLKGAWEFYQQIKKDYPGRKIVLTGHSLGGHIATYVGTKAHEQANLPCAVVAVRTFNTAPFSEEVSKKVVKDIDDNIEKKFINIRLSNDPISSINPKRYFGNIFSFRSKTSNPIDAHMLWAMDESLPDSVKRIPVSSSPIDIFKENMQGMMHAYECRVKGQFFSPFRLGMKNLVVLQRLINEISSLIATGTGTFDVIEQKVEFALKQLHGEQSVKMLQELQKLIQKPKEEKMMVEMKVLKSPSGRG
jgi:hypothetical protein